MILNPSTLLKKYDSTFPKKSVRLSNLELFYNRQEQEEVRPLYGAGLFSLTTEYKKFKVDNAQWHQLSMKKR